MFSMHTNIDSLPQECLYVCVRVYRGIFEPKMYWKFIRRCVLGVESNLLRPFVLVFTCGHIFVDTAGGMQRKLVHYPLPGEH